MSKLIAIICILTLLLASCSTLQDVSNYPSNNDKVELTLAGIYIPYFVKLAVIHFNEKSTTHQISIIEYVGESWFEGGTVNDTYKKFQDNFTRFQVEMIAGRGPDIIFDPMGWLTNHKFLIDLYPFLDADPELNRSDFFPNMISALESPDGALTTITDNFIIHTMLGTSEVAHYVGNWTPEALHALVLKDDPGSYRTLSVSMPRCIFMKLMLSYGNLDLINWETNEANLNSELFISLLRTSKLLKELNPREFVEGKTPEERMLDGEQLIDLMHYFQPFSYSFHNQPIGDIVMLGIPTPDGGAHFLEPQWLMGINASSKNVSAAWEFMRLFLLHTTPYYDIDPITLRHSFFNPIRVDRYKERINELRTPIMITDSSGNLIEQSIGGVIWDRTTRDYVIPLFSMSDYEVEIEWEVTTTARGRVYNLPFELWAMIEADLDYMYSGIRSVENTARVINSRVQRYLNERG